MPTRVGVQNDAFAGRGSLTRILDPSLVRDELLTRQTGGTGVFNGIGRTPLGRSRLRGRLRRTLEMSFELKRRSVVKWMMYI